MKIINLREFARRPAVLNKVAKGETLVLKKRNDPIAIVFPITDKAFRFRIKLVELSRELKKEKISEKELLQMLKEVRGTLCQKQG